MLEDTEFNYQGYSFKLPILKEIKELIEENNRLIKELIESNKGV